MLDSSYSAESFLQELSADVIQADFGFLRECGGRKRLQRLLVRLTKQAAAEKRSLISNVSEFQSPRGNRWLVFLHASPGGEADTPSWVRLRVDADSEGYTVYLYLSDKIGKGYAAFTPRFFQGYAESLGYSALDQAVLAQFMLDLRVQELRIAEPDEEGGYALQWGFQQGVGTGSVVSFHPYVLTVTDYWPGGSLRADCTALRPQAVERLRKGVKVQGSDDPRRVMMTNFLVALLNRVLLELSVTEEKREAFFSLNQPYFGDKVAGLLKEWYAEGKGLHMASLVRIFREFQKRAVLFLAVSDEELMQRMERIALDMYS